MGDSAFVVEAGNSEEVGPDSDRFRSKHGNTGCEIEQKHHRSKFDPSQVDHVAIWTKSCHTYDRNLVVQKKTEWRGPTPTK